MWSKIRIFLARRFRFFRVPPISQHARDLKRIREEHDDTTRTLVNLIHIGRDPDIAPRRSRCKSPR